MALYESYLASSGNAKAWINPNISEAFPTKTLDLIANNNDVLTVCTLTSPNFINSGVQYRVQSQFTVSRGSSYQITAEGTSNTRTITIGNDGSVTISNASSTVNNYCIPVYITLT